MDNKEDKETCLSEGTLHNVTFTSLNCENETTSMKVEVNTFLWQILPGETTLNEAEDLACRIFDLIKAHSEALKARQIK